MKPGIILIAIGCIANIFVLAIYPPVTREVAYFTIGFDFLFLLSFRYSRRILQPWMLSFGILPWLLAAAFLWNGKADGSPSTLHSAVVLGIGHGKSGPYAIINSWESDHRLSIQISPHCPVTIDGGSTITVIEHSGALGIHWLGGIAECKLPHS